MEIALDELEFGKSLASCVQCESLSDSTKLLPCSHILCQDCFRELESLGNCNCSKCGHIVKDDEFVEENYFADLFLRSDEILKKLRENYPCSKCQHLTSSMYCITCDCFLCSVDFHIAHKQNGNLCQHDYICVNEPKKAIYAFEKSRNILKDIFVKSDQFRKNDKVNTLYKDLIVYEQLIELWRAKHRNIETSFEETKFMEIECVSEVNTYYNSIIEVARAAMVRQSREIARYYDKERGKLHNKLVETNNYLQRLEQTKGLIDIYIHFSDSYELIDKSSALIGRLERIGKEIIETEWQYPDVVPLKFKRTLVSDVTSNFGVLKESRNFQGKIYPNISFGAYGNSNGHFKALQDIALHRNKTLFILDSGSRSVNAFSTTGKFLFKFGTYGNRCGQFLDPRHITIEEDLAYVTDTGRCDVQIFSCKTGKFIDKFGTKGNRSGQLSSPHGIAISKKTNKIFVVDRPKQCVNVYSPGYEFVTEICKGFLKEPCDIAISTNGDIYVLDCSSRCVHVFNESGKLLREYGGRGENMEMINPCYLTLHGQRHVIISDRLGHKICVYTLHGDLVSEIGGFGSQPGRVNFVNGVTVDSEGNIFVCDTANHRVQRF